MTRVLTAGAVLLMTTSALSAAGIERTRNPYGNLFEEGGYLELTYSNVFPNVEGDYTSDLEAFGSESTGSMAEDYFNFGFTYKDDVTDQLSFGLFVNSPYGADADYGAGAYSGLRAEWNSRQVAALLKYKINGNFSVYGGIRYVESDAEIIIPDLLVRAATAEEAEAALARGDLAEAQRLGAIAQTTPQGELEYSADGDRDGATGYVAGVAYERPDIALRVALTYESELDFEFDTEEQLAGFGIDAEGTTDVTVPQVITLDFQTGIAQDTLLFGSIQWAEWSVWQVSPPEYEDALNRRVTGIDNDAVTYQLGVGRRFSEDFAGFVRATHEPGNGDEASRLAPTDGLTSLGIGGTYTYENVEMTIGAEYIWVGDATDGSGVEFEDNTAIGIGASFGFRF